MKVKNLFTLLFLLSFLPVQGQRSEKCGWYVKDYNEAKAKQYLDNYSELDKIEGIWQSTDGFKYAIEKDVENNNRNNKRFRMIILESSNNGWSNTEIKGFIEYGSIDEIYSMKYYVKNLYDGSELATENVFLLFENPILMSFQRLNSDKISLYKLYPKTDNKDLSGNQTTDQPIEKWSGSCVAIGNRTVATNFHVIENADELTITDIKGNKYTAEVILKDPVSDLAVLKINDSHFKGFNIRYGFKENISDMGTSIFVLGYPLTTTMGEDIKLTTGVISSKTGFQGDVSQYQISAAVQPGNSGGPLFDENGYLIGIVSAKHLGAENVSYAIKLRYLKNLLDTYHEPIFLNNRNTISTLTLPEKIKAVSSCVLLVEASSGTKSKKSNRVYNNNQQTPDINNDKINNAVTAHNYMLIGEEGKAYEFYKKTDISKLNKTELNEYARCSYLTGHFEDALNASQAGLILDPKNVVFNRLSMYSYYEIGNYQEAKKYANIIFSNFKYNNISEYDHFYAALICKTLKETDKAFYHFNKALELINDSSLIKRCPVLKCISDTHLDNNSFEKAITYYKEYINCLSTPKSDDFDGLARIYLKYANADGKRKREMINKAIEIYKFIRNNFPDNKIYATYQCAVIINELDKDAEKGLAKKDFEEVVSLLSLKLIRDNNENNMLKYSYHYLMTYAFLYCENKDLAKEYAKNILDIDPDYTPAQQILKLE